MTKTLDPDLRIAYLKAKLAMNEQIETMYREIQRMEDALEALELTLSEYEETED